MVWRGDVKERKQTQKKFPTDEVIQLEVSLFSEINLNQKNILHYSLLSKC